jgi:hypothetical protein
VQGHAIVVLALLDETGARPFVRRAALDPNDAAHRRVLDGLATSFGAEIALFTLDGRYERTVRVVADRAANVALVLERAARSRPEGRVDVSTALERALAVPPPVREPGHPFGDETSTGSPKEALAAIARLAEWSTAERVDRALLLLGVAKARVDGAFRQVLDASLRYGVPLPPAIVTRAAALGLPVDPAELVGKQVEAFHATTTRADKGGLGAAQIADAWEQLLNAATDHDVAIDSATHEHAWKAIRSARGESGAHALVDVDPAKIPEMGKPELLLLLDHPRVRQRAALELCRRSDPELVDALYKAVRKMPRSDVARVVPKIVAFGEAAGDALIDGLSARKTFVRQASALALGHLKLRRAVVPLIHLLENEPSDVWKEVARVLGELGQGAYRSLGRNLKEPKTTRGRYALTLAYLANHGCDKQVGELAYDSDPELAALGREAVTLRDVAKSVERRVAGKEPITADDSILQFSRRFQEEVSGTAPTEDLADLSD